MQHVVIRRESYVAGTRDRPEVGVFTQTHARRRPVPWGRIAVNDRVWMKWQGGPLVARARVRAFRQVERCTPGQLRAATAGYRLHDLPDYWLSLPPSFAAVVVYLVDEEWLEQPFEPAARSYGESWIVLERAAQIEAWLHTVPFELPAEARTPGRRGSRTVRPSLRFEVFRRDDFRCRYCGRRSPEVVLHVDHRVPWSLGGATSLENLVTACRDCNLGKGVRRVAEQPGPYTMHSGWLDGTGIRA